MKIFKDGTIEGTAAELAEYKMLTDKKQPYPPLINDPYQVTPFNPYAPYSPWATVIYGDVPGTTSCGQTI
ncbi:hypothetical protein [Paenibacillus rhizolycopersici]|uniref:hypothetical protein n=1 Tax=Paenibacillus rhizolycopersici TaxID=2780073 RepID=UPI003D29D068